MLSSKIVAVIVYVTQRNYMFIVYWNIIHVPLFPGNYRASGPTDVSNANCYFRKYGSSSNYLHISTNKTVKNLNTYLENHYVYYNIDMANFSNSILVLGFFLEFYSYVHIILSDLDFFFVIADNWS